MQAHRTRGGDIVLLGKAAERLLRVNDGRGFHQIEARKSEFFGNEGARHIGNVIARRHDEIEIAVLDEGEQRVRIAVVDEMRLVRMRVAGFIRPVSANGNMEAAPFQSE